MPDSRKPITDEGLRYLILRELERIPQDCRNRYAKRVETMGAAHIAQMIVQAMRSEGWTVEGPAHDRQNSQMAYNRTHLK